MADEIIASISYIRTVSKKKETIEKILRIYPNQKFVVRHGRLKV